MYNSKILSEIVSNIQIPKMFTIKQKFPDEYIEDDLIYSLVQSELAATDIKDSIRPNMRIAITVGSRGISNIALIIKSIADYIKAKGAIPFIVPAMGSHGGATAEGQRELIEGYGITETNIGCEILSSMEVKCIGLTEENNEVFIDKYAAEADGIIVCGRIKPHTAFRGKYESGIMKMMAIGLGKQYGAEIIHQNGFQNMAKNVPLYGKAVIKNSPVLFGVGIIENAYDKTYKIEVMRADEIEKREPELLEIAFEQMPRVLVDETDVLVVDYVGKNFSGDGMDPNITGTFCTPYATGGIGSQKVVVLDVSEESHGNAIGIGYSSVITRKLYQKLDLTSMYLNAITCTVLGGARIPIVMDNDMMAIKVAIKTCNEIDFDKVRIVRIQNSLSLERIMLSEVFYEEALQNPNIEILTEPKELLFEEDNIITKYL